jgi:ceramide glucosyltransferase
VSAAWLAGVVAWAIVVLMVQIVAVVRATRMQRGSQMARRPSPRARFLLVRPCAGAEPSLARTLASVARSRWSFDLCVRFTVDSDNDAALPVAQTVAAELAFLGIDARALIAESGGPNHKTGQLAAATHRWLEPSLVIDGVIVVDSDIDLEGFDLDALVAPMMSEGTKVGAVWSPPVEGGRAVTLGDRLSAAVLCGSLHAFPLLGTLDGAGLVGKTFAVRADALRHIGGFSALVRHLGEDMALARRLRERGWEVRMSAQVVRSRASRRALRVVFERYVRWMLVLRVQRPRLLPTVPLLLAATPLILGSLFLVACTSTHLAWPMLGLACGLLVSRLVVAHAASRIAGRRTDPSRVFGDAVLADLLLLGAVVRALGPRRVRWRERTLRIGAGGLLEQEARDAIQAGARPCPHP